ncbi:hypothetical protein D082_10130 [Synechocystis sp. PCC 6714]|nr:hypothetical protein D082_10130 [Synechocystis sp. PCC 6714]
MSTEIFAWINGQFSCLLASPNNSSLIWSVEIIWLWGMA